MYLSVVGSSSSRSMNCWSISSSIRFRTYGGCACGTGTCTDAQFCHYDQTCESTAMCDLQGQIALNIPCMCGGQPGGGAVTCEANKYCNIWGPVCEDTKICDLQGQTKPSSDTTCACGGVFGTDVVMCDDTQPVEILRNT